VQKPFTQLDVLLWSENKVGTDTFLGSFSLTLLELSDQQQVQKWFKVTKKAEKDKVYGEISAQIVYKYLPVHLSPIFFHFSSFF
jgi:hypothetical protein